MRGAGRYGGRVSLAPGVNESRINVAAGEIHTTRIIVGQRFVERIEGPHGDDATVGNGDAAILNNASRSGEYGRVNQVMSSRRRFAETRNPAPWRLARSRRAPGTAGPTTSERLRIASWSIAGIPLKAGGLALLSRLVRRRLDSA